MKELKKIVYRQALDCIELINSLPHPKRYTIKIDNGASLQEFIEYADSIETEGSASSVTFKDPDNVEVSLEDFVMYQFHYTESAITLREMFANNIDELRNLQDEKQELICELFSEKTFYADYDYYVITDDDDYANSFDKHTCQILSVKFESDEDSITNNEPTIIVELNFIIDGEENITTFFVQTVGGYYMPQLGCLTLGQNGESYNNDEKVLLELYDVPELAQEWYKLNTRSNEIYHSTNFNVSINSQSLYIKEYEGTFKFAIVNDDFNIYGYDVPETLVSSFNSLDEAMKELEKYRTDSYEDFTGLATAIRDLLNQHEIETYY